ncbi:hypothetical protein BDA96_03G329400 [Sorghum bicolor]|uniref:Secreted protein n=2 Tax=Sorghum bicolor TaxID=4558 RepID=A0A921URV5_SORBI|nr:hypothetical protein BDA96_03G329400 [Sorghum bicolor]KXG33431.1 hypothetical protein SORBI_3003G304900 [Sorghum bicolor]
MLCWLLLLQNTCNPSCQLLLVVLFNNICQCHYPSNRNPDHLPPLSSLLVPQPSPFDGVLMLQQSGDPGRRGVDPARTQP